jgi:hypothetical protein
VFTRQQLDELFDYTVDAIMCINDECEWEMHSEAGDADELYAAAADHCRKVHTGLPLAILNTSIVTADGRYALETVSADLAKSIVMMHAEIDSAVGHEATAAILSTLLDVDVPVNRQLFAQQVGQSALVFKLNGRPEPGKELSREELERIGFTFKVLTRMA